MQKFKRRSTSFSRTINTALNRARSTSSTNSNPRCSSKQTRQVVGLSKQRLSTYNGGFTRAKFQAVDLLQCPISQQHKPKKSREYSSSQLKERRKSAGCTRWIEQMKTIQGASKKCLRIKLSDVKVNQDEINSKGHLSSEGGLPDALLQTKRTSNGLNSLYKMTQSTYNTTSRTEVSPLKLDDFPMTDKSEYIPEIPKRLRSFKVFFNSIELKCKLFPKIRIKVPGNTIKGSNKQERLEDSRPWRYVKGGLKNDSYPGISILGSKRDSISNITQSIKRDSIDNSIMRRSTGNKQPRINLLNVPDCSYRATPFPNSKARTASENDSIDQDDNCKNEYSPETKKYWEKYRHELEASKNKNIKLNKIFAKRSIISPETSEASTSGYVMLEKENSEVFNKKASADIIIQKNLNDKIRKSPIGNPKRKLEQYGIIDESQWSAPISFKKDDFLTVVDMNCGVRKIENGRTNIFSEDNKENGSWASLLANSDKFQTITEVNETYFEESSFYRSSKPTPDMTPLKNCPASSFTNTIVYSYAFDIELKISTPQQRETTIKGVTQKKAQITKKALASDCQSFEEISQVSIPCTGFDIIRKIASESANLTFRGKNVISEADDFETEEAITFGDSPPQVKESTSEPINTLNFKLQLMREQFKQQIDEGRNSINRTIQQQLQERINDSNDDYKPQELRKSNLLSSLIAKIQPQMIHKLNDSSINNSNRENSEPISIISENYNDEVAKSFNLMDFENIQRFTKSIGSSDNLIDDKQNCIIEEALQELETTNFDFEESPGSKVIQVWRESLERIKEEENEGGDSIESRSQYSIPYYYGDSEQSVKRDNLDFTIKSLDQSPYISPIKDGNSNDPIQSLISKLRYDA